MASDLAKAKPKPGYKCCGVIQYPAGTSTTSKMNTQATKNKEIAEKSHHVFVSVKNTLKISNYRVFAREFLKKKVLWDSNGTYTMQERNAALSSLAVALNAEVSTRLLLQFCMRLKRSHTKKIQSYLQWCISKKVPPELTMYRAGIPTWVKEMEAKLQTLPKLILEYRLNGLIPPEDLSEVVFRNFVYNLAERCHNTQRLPTIGDTQKVATDMGLKNYKLMHKLWNRQKESALYKFRCLQQSGDVAKDIAFALTQFEWRVVDLVVLYVKDFNIVFSSSFKNNFLIQPLLTLYHFVKTCRVEENDGGDEREKWAKVVKKYSKKFVTSPSGSILQRRWCELKLQVRNNILRRLRTEGYKVHPLLVEIAAKYPYIVKEVPQDWSDLVKKKKFYDVSNVQVDFSSDEEDGDETGDNNEADKTTDADGDSDYDSEDERPLVIDETNTPRKGRSLPDLNWVENDTKSNLNPTETQDPDEDTPPTPRKNPMQAPIDTNETITHSIIEHKTNSEITALNDDLQSQLSNILYNDSTHKIMTCNNTNPVIHLKDHINESEFEKLERQLEQQISYMKRLKNSSLSSDHLPPYETSVKVNKSRTLIDKKSNNIKTDEKVRDSTVNRGQNKTNLTTEITSTSNECTQGTSKSNSLSKMNNDEKAKTKSIENKAIKTKSEPIDAKKGIVATVYACKTSDGSDLGHLIMPGPINKESVKITLKSKDGMLAIDSCVVNDPKSPKSASKQSDLDLLQKIDPAQTESVIIYSDSDDEENNKTNNEDVSPEEGQINLNDVKKYLNKHNLDDVLTKMDHLHSNEGVQNNKTSNKDEPKAPEKDHINLNDVKKYLSNHSLDDILTKMDDMFVKKEVVKKEKEVNRFYESYIYVSDSEGSDVELSIVENKDSNVNTDVTSKNEHNDKINVQDDELKKGVESVLGCPSNEHTMHNNVLNSIDAQNLPQDVCVTGDNALSVPNANVLIIPPNILIPALDALRVTSNAVSTNGTYYPPTVDALTPPPNVVSTNGIYQPPIVNSPNLLIATPNVVNPIPNIQNPPSNLLVPTPSIPIPTPNLLVPTPSISNPTPNLLVPTPSIPIPTPNVLVPTPSIPNPTPNVLIPTPIVSTSNIVIPTPNSNVVTMIINDKIGKDSTDSNKVIDLDDDSLSNLGINVIDKPSRKAPEKTAPKKKTTNVPKPKRYRTTKTYTDTGYSGLFKLKERSTKETVGMLCPIRDEKNLVSEVTKKIDNYLERSKDNLLKEKGKEQKSEHHNLFYDILSKKMEIEKKKDTASGSFLKMLLDNSQTKTLWTTGEKKRCEKEEESVNERPTGIDPKLIMDTRIYLPKLDEIETYNKNRRVDFSINTKRISKVGYKILNYKRPSDPIPILDTDDGEAVPVTDHIESEISVALKKKVPDESNMTIQKGMSTDKLIVTPTENPSVLKRSYAVDLKTEQLDNLTKRIKKERELQNIIQDKYKATGVLNKTYSTAKKIKNERLKQQLINDKSPKIAQRIKFETDDSDFFSNIESLDNLLENNEENKITTEENQTESTASNSFLQSVLQGTIQSTNDKIIKSTGENQDGNTNYDSEGSEDMELDTIDNTTLILDSSNIQNTNTSESNQIVEETRIANISNNKEISTNDKITNNQNEPGNSNVKIKSENYNVKATNNHKENVKTTVAVKVEGKDAYTEKEQTKNTNEQSDDDDIQIIPPKKVKRIVISSDDEDSYHDEDSKDSKHDGDSNNLDDLAADELATRIEKELLKDEDISAGNDLLEEIDRYSSSDEEPANNNNIDEMLKLCKPVKLCLERVEVPKDTAQVRKVELPDLASLKRHRAPTAHVAPINVRAPSESEGTDVATDDATEAEIGNLLQQLTMETASEWQRLEETLIKNETIKPKRFKFHNYIEEPMSTKKDSNKVEQSAEKKPVRRTKRKEEMKKKKRSPQKCTSDDEIDQTLEWQRQKNINYRFFNFNPINQLMDPDTSHSTTKKQQPKKYRKPSKKEAILIKKMVVDANEASGMNENQEIIDLKEFHQAISNKNEVDNAVATITSDTDNVMLIDNDNDGKTSSDKDIFKIINSKDPVVKGNEPVMPVLTKIEPRTEYSNILKPIATKVKELVDEENKERHLSKPKKDYSTLTLRNFVTKPKFSIQYQNRNNPLPSTSQDIVSKENPVTSQNESSKSESDLICISDDSNDVFRLTDTISVKNSENNVKPNELRSLPTHVAVKKENLDVYKARQNSNSNVTDNNNEKNVVQPKSVGTEILNMNIEKSLLQSKPVLDPPVNVMFSNIQTESHASKPLKMMEIRPIGSEVNKAKPLLDKRSSNTECNKVNDNKINNITTKQTTIGIDSDNCQDSGHLETVYPRIETVISVQHIVSILNEQSKSNEKGEDNDIRPQIKSVTSVPDSIDLDNDSSNDLVIDYSPNISDHDSDVDNLQIDKISRTNSKEDNTVYPFSPIKNNPAITIEKLHSNLKNNKNVPKFNTPQNSITILKLPSSNKRIDTCVQDDNSLPNSEVDNNIPTKNKFILHNKGVSPKDLKSDEPSISKQEKDKSNNDIGDSANKTKYTVSTMSGSEENIPTSTYKSKKENTQTNIEKENMSKKSKIEENRDSTNNKDNSRSTEKNYTESKNYNNAIENNSQSKSNDIMDIDVKHKTSENHSENTYEPRIFDELYPESDHIPDISESNSQINRDTKSEGENLEATINDTIDTVMTESENKPQTFLKLVPIQKLRGEPMPSNEEAVGKEKLRGQAMPFHCTVQNADEDTQSAEEFGHSEDDVTGMPVISNVVSLSATEVPEQRPASPVQIVRVVKPIPESQAELIQARIWKPCVPDIKLKPAPPRLNPSDLSTRPALDIAAFIQHRDCTNISLLCVDENRPLWKVPSNTDKVKEKFTVVTNLKITPSIGRPTYWTVGPREECTRVLLNETASGSTTVGVLSVPDEVFIENNWYKKLSSDPMIYAKIWFVLPDFKTCKDMIQSNNNAQMSFYSLLTGAMWPFDGNALSATKTTLYKINTNNLSTALLPQLATLIQNSAQKKSYQIAVKGVLKPTGNPGEVISLDSDDD